MSLIILERTISPKSVKLKTERLILTPFQKEDWKTMYSLFTNPFVRKYLWDDQVISLDQVESILSENENHFRKESWGLWRIQFRQMVETIGFAGLWCFFGERQPQVLYGLLPEFTQRGIATEAAQKVMEYAFDTLNFSNLTAAMDEPHIASQKVAERLGMKVFDQRLEEGKPTIFYGISRKDFEDQAIKRTICL